MNAVRTVVAKEVVDNLRDRRTVVTAMLLPLFGPLIMCALVYALAQVAKGRGEGSMTLSVVGREHAPNLVAHLEANGVTVKSGPASAEAAEAAVRDDELPLVLIVSEAFGEQLRAGQPAVVRVVYDQTDRSASGRRGRVMGLLRQYDQRLAAQRLLVRGVSPTLARAVVVESTDVSTREGRGALVLGFLPMLLVLAVFLGGMYVAIDTTAGERERGSLDALLINPVPRWQFAFGKLIATWIFTYATLLVAVVAFVVVMRLIPPRTLAALDIEVAFAPSAALTIAVALLPLSVFASAVQMLIATFCKSFKEAQTYVSLVMMLPMLPALLLMGAPTDPEQWMMLIPTLSEQLTMLAIVRGDALDPQLVGLSAASTSLYAALLFAAVVRLYGSERILSPG